MEVSRRRGIFSQHLNRHLPLSPHTTPSSLSSGLQAASLPARSPKQPVTRGAATVTVRQSQGSLVRVSEWSCCVCIVMKSCWMFPYSKVKHHVTVMVRTLSSFGLVTSNHAVMEVSRRHGIFSHLSWH